MRWLLLCLAGPMLWALVFSAIYGLHGVVCAGVAGPEALGPTGRAVLIAIWVVGMAAFVPLLRRLPTGGGLARSLPRAGAWTGLAATAFTLFPVMVATSC